MVALFSNVLAHNYGMANYGIFCDFILTQWTKFGGNPARFFAALCNFDHHGLAFLSCKQTNAFIHKFSNIHSVQNTNYHAVSMSIMRQIHEAASLRHPVLHENELMATCHATRVWACVMVTAVVAVVTWVWVGEQVSWQCRPALGPGMGKVCPHSDVVVVMVMLVVLNHWWCYVAIVVIVWHRVIALAGHRCGCECLHVDDNVVAVILSWYEHGFPHIQALGWCHSIMGSVSACLWVLPVQFSTAEWLHSHCFNPIAAPMTCSAANHDVSRTTEIPTATSSVQSGQETLLMFAARQSVINASSLSRDVATSLAMATTGSRVLFCLQPEVRQGFPWLCQYQVPHDDDDLSWGYVPCCTASQYINVLGLLLYMYTHKYINASLKVE